MNDLIRLQIESIRVGLNVLELMLDQNSTPLPVEVVACEHPEEQRRENPSFDAPRQFICVKCGKLINPDAPMGKE